MDMSDAPTPETSVDGKRNLQRSSLFIMGSIKVAESDVWVPIKIKNLSASGLMAEGKVTCQQGDRVAVEAKGKVDAEGSVAWIVGGRIGIAFDTLIDPQELKQPVGDGKDLLPIYLRPDPGRPGRRPGLKAF